MKVFKNAQLKIFVLLTAVLMIFAAFLVGVPVTRAFANDGMPENITYIDTELESIALYQRTDSAYLGFKLSESDYDYKTFETDHAGTDAFDTYEQYIAVWLTYWKNFSKMNSESARFPAYWAYWNGSSMEAPGFEKTFAHRISKKMVEYGFYIEIPAGTTFPSAEYVYGGCVGEVVMYRTITAKSFYFNGTSFELLSEEIVKEREGVFNAMDTVKLTDYYVAEQALVKEAKENAKAQMKVSFTSREIQEVLTKFNADIAKIMTIEGHKSLNAKKTAAKATINNNFESYNVENYYEQDWNEMLAIQNEGVALIDTLTSEAEVELAVAGIQLAFKNVMTKSERDGFTDYLSAAQASLEAAFNQSLYREAESAQGAALVQEGKQAISQATTYAAADATKLEYIAAIKALKTKAQYEEEEQKNQPQKNPPVSSEEEVEESGCGCSLNAIPTAIMAVLVAAWMINKKKDGMEA